MRRRIQIQGCYNFLASMTRVATATLISIPRRALPVADALVRDLVVERVRPQRRVGERRRDGRVVDEAELLHHEELPVKVNKL